MKDTFFYFLAFLSGVVTTIIVTVVLLEYEYRSHLI